MSKRTLDQLLVVATDMIEKVKKLKRDLGVDDDEVAESGAPQSSSSPATTTNGGASASSSSSEQAVVDDESIKIRVGGYLYKESKALLMRKSPFFAELFNDNSSSNTKKQITPNDEGVYIIDCGKDHGSII
nr:unnamed protein product [Naegleria fowleri]